MVVTSYCGCGYGGDFWIVVVEGASGGDSLSVSCGCGGRSLSW